ncbi:MAG: hypothetical protein RI909_256, partial [Bacteroidota bacterium]
MITRMNTMIRVVFIFSVLFILVTCSPPAKENWEVLFDGSSLDGWDSYLGAPRMKDDTTVYQPIGLNTDTSVFKIVNLDGEPVLRVSGEIWGGISTKREFENYHLQLQFKWGTLRWYPKENDRRDSGLLYHGVGEHGKGDGFWLRSQEFQIQEEDCGDYWGVAGAMFDINASLNADSIYQYDPKGTLLTFSQHSPTGRHCKKYPDAEKPSGEWNTIDLYCFKNTSVHVMNGVVVMVLENSRQSDNGTETGLSKGKIQLQSESAEVFYRNIKISPIESLPPF